MRSRLCILAFVLLAAGCGGYWGRRPIDEAQHIDRRTPVWIWSGGGEARKWRDVIFTQDSVSGIPYETPDASYRDRRSIARSQIDSMKVGYRTLPQNALIVVGVVTAALAAEAAVCYVLQVKSDC